MVGMSDERDKLVISLHQGALFLPNLDDDSQSCKDGASVKSETCFDANDEIVNGPEDAKDLAPVPTLPIDVSDQATGSVRILADQTDRIRLFIQTTPGQYKAVTDQDRFDAAQLRAGLKLVLEDKDIARNKTTWDGSVRLRFEVTDGSRRAADEVALRVAPILTHTHAETVEQLVASPVNHSLYDAFRRDLEAGLAKAQNKAPLSICQRMEKMNGRRIGLNPHRQESDAAPRLGAFLPNAINSVVLPEHKNLLVPKPFGPVITGKDILQESITQTLQSVGYALHYMDDFLTYHEGGGEVHCGSNTLRAMRNRWWVE